MIVVEKVLNKGLYPRIRATITRSYTEYSGLWYLTSGNRLSGSLLVDPPYRDDVFLLDDEEMFAVFQAMATD